MTVAMEAMYRRLPEHERYPLPPRQVTMNAAAKAGVGPPPDESERTGLTLAAHFGYGAAMGALYTPLGKKFPLPGILKGVLFGLVVWTASYLALLPMSGMSESGQREPVRRNLMMIAAHIVWGSAMGLAADTLMHQ